MAFTISEETSVNRLVRPKNKTLLLTRTDRPRRAAEACESRTVRDESRTVGYTGVPSVGATRACVPLRSAHVGCPLGRAADRFAALGGSPVYSGYFSALPRMAHQSNFRGGELPDDPGALVTDAASSCLDGAARGLYETPRQYRKYHEVRWCCLAREFRPAVDAKCLPGILV